VQHRGVHRPVTVLCATSWGAPSGNSAVCNIVGCTVR